MKKEKSRILAQIIEEYIKEQGLQDGLQKMRIFKTWDLVVGERVAKATLDKFFKDGILYCTIGSSMIRSQLSFRKDDIRVQINKMLNSNLINNIVLK
ncbi:MAG: DUF721 domain-containing protein [Bacteroidales bacterium]|jgi:predicted nucleic acid-binding Zn ribbon protein